MRFTLCCTLAAIFAVASPALAGDVSLELVGGRRVEGRILAVGPTRVVIDGPGGARFIERGSIQSVTDGGAPVDLAKMASSTEVAAIVLQHQIVVAKDAPDTSVRVRRGERTLDLSSLRGTEALLRPRDEIRTGPYGRVTVLLPSGAKLSARTNAIVRFDDAGDASLEEGVIHAEHLTGELSIALPTGRLRALRAIVEVEHLRGCSLIGCYAGVTAELDARDGFQVEIPRNHVVTVACEDGTTPAYVAASPSNAWPVNVRTRPNDAGLSRRFAVKPNERVTLLFDLAAAPPAPRVGAPAPRDPADLARREPPPEPVIPRPSAPSTPRLAVETTPSAGRVVEAAGPFMLKRAGQSSKPIEPQQARGLALEVADEIGTVDAGIDVEVGDARLALDPGTTAALDDDSGRARLRLARGSLAASTTNRASVALIDGEIAFAAGKVALRSRPVPGGNRIDARVEKGRGAQLSVGKDLIAVLGSGDGLAASSVGGAISAEVLAQGGSTPPTLSLAGGGIEVAVAQGHAVEVSRQGNVLALVLSNGSALEIDDSVRATIADSGQEPEVVLEDGTRIKMSAGARRRVRAPGRKPEPREIAKAPEPIRPLEEPPPARVEPRIEPPTPAPVPAPEPPRPEPPKPAAAGVETKTLSNGAVLVLKGWGPLDTRPAGASFVAVVGAPGSTLAFGPNARATLSRVRGGVRVETEDGRSVTHEAGAPPIVLRLGAEQRLSVEVQGDRAITCEPGAQMSLFVRGDGEAVSLVFGQTYYLRPGQPAFVDFQHGLHLGPYMARQRDR